MLLSPLRRLFAPSRWKRIGVLWSLPSIGWNRLLLLAGVSAAAVLSQAASIGMLLPTIQALEDPGAPTPGGVIGRTVDWAFDGLGISRSLSVLFIVVFALIAIAQLIRYLYDVIAVRTVQLIISDLRSAAFSSFLSARWPFHLRHSSGDLIGTVIQDGHRAEVGLGAATDLVIRSFMVGTVTIILFLMSWEMALIAVGILAVSMGISQFYLRGSGKLGIVVSDHSIVLLARGAERLQGIAALKLSNREEVEADWFRREARTLADVSWRLAAKAAEIRLVSEPLVVGAGLVIVYVGVVVLNIALAEMAVFVYALVRLAPEARAVSTARFRIGAHWPSVQRLTDSLTGAQDVSELTPEAVGGRELAGLRGPVQFRGTGLIYDSGQRALDGVSIDILPGQHVAIVGPSGGGKSTLLALLVGLLEPTSGQALIADVPIGEFDLRSLRSGVGLVQQDPFIFGMSVRDNIAYAKPDATDEQVREAALEANADEFIRGLPKGYDTPLGERGTGLSIGQRQRLGLARVLLLKPGILLLDEVTSAQDAASERAIREAVLSVGSDRTVIMVSHRLSFVNGVDRVIVLVGGRVEQDGTPQELLDAEGTFREYHDLQIGSEKPQTSRRT